MEYRRVQIIIVLLVAFFTRCSKIYNPALEKADDIIVIEAHMTDITETYFVKITLTSGFSSSDNSDPVSGAKVWVTDNMNNNIQHYYETGKGYYTFNPDPESKGIIGHTYILHIETSEGDIYESAPEVMTSPVPVASVHGILNDRTEQMASDENSSASYVNRTYLDIISLIQSDDISTPRLRFDPEWIYEMINYHRDITGGPPVPPTYSWNYIKNNSLIISAAQDNSVAKEEYSGSLLVDNLADFYSKNNLAFIILVMNYYSLNNESFIYYNDVERQSSTNDALFDPITTQIRGNIKCLSDPEKPVAGLFDVASHEMLVFFVNPGSGNSTTAIRKVDRFNGLPGEPEGKTEGIPPYWWFD